MVAAAYFSLRLSVEAEVSWLGVMAQVYGQLGVALKLLMPDSKSFQPEVACPVVFLRTDQSRQNLE